MVAKQWIKTLTPVIPAITNKLVTVFYADQIGKPVPSLFRSCIFEASTESCSGNRQLNFRYSEYEITLTAETLKNAFDINGI